MCIMRVAADRRSVRMKQEPKQQTSDSAKKPYFSPNLVEYGTVAKLTQSVKRKWHRPSRKLNVCL